MRQVMQYDVPNIPLRYAQYMPNFFYLRQDPHIYVQKVRGLYIIYILYAYKVKKKLELI